MLLLTEYLGGHRGVAVILRSKPMQTWPAPFCCCCPKVRPDGRFLYLLKYGALQYVILSPLLAMIAIALASFELYEDGDLRPDRGFLYVALMQNITQLASLYALVWLYVLMDKELKPFCPLAKFLVVKSVVFFTFWQSVGLAILVKAGVIHPWGEFTVGGQPVFSLILTPFLMFAEVQVAIQDFLVCIGSA